ncbi:hypothetical protein Q0812_01760 [Brevundimonas sp. 2R-24]|uniref:Uncharacterized protein n=1 Tax=Peiella sedimenti TaxID=3061083 RepID=A0ABT8SJC2_9CAUL|nr:hypothetical protein [Caulobacteraceae bacterium XZ-24]
MTEQEKSLGHALMSFALMGPLLAAPRGGRPPRTRSRPSSYEPLPELKRR